jgi:hypothetical protein
MNIATENASEMAVGRLIRPFSKPMDLLEISTAHRWWFSTSKSREVGSYSWAKMMVDGHSLMAPSNAGFLELGQRYFGLLRNGHGRTGHWYPFETVAGKTNIALRICNFVKSLGFDRLIDFGAGDFNRHKDKIVTGFDQNRSVPVGQSYIRHVLAVFADLHHFFAIPDEVGTFRLNDGFAQQLFTDEEANALVGRGNETGRTKDIPSEVAFALMDASIEYVVDHSEGILELLQISNALEQPPPKRVGQRVRKQAMAARLLEIAQGTFDSPLHKRTGKLNRSEVARGLGISPGNFDKSLGRLVDTALYGKPKRVREKAIEALRKVAVRPPAAPSLKRDYQARTQSLGLPYYGVVGAGYVPWPIVNPANSMSGEYTLYTASNDLYSSAVVIIAAFDAGRIEEVLSLDVDCLVEAADGWYLKCKIAKNTTSEGSTFVLKPCPPIVRKAVQVVQRLGAEARAKHGSNKLFFEINRHNAGVIKYHTIRWRVLEFARRTGVCLRDDGEQWSLGLHQLRRFFVTMWIDYYDFGARFESCRRMLTHDWIGTTIRYGTSIEQGRALTEAQRRLTFRVLKSAAFEGLRDVRGAAGLRLAKVVERLRIRARSEAEIAALIEKRIEHYKVAVHPMPWGYCIWDSLSGQRARCAPKGERSKSTIRPTTKKSCENCAECACFWSNAKFADFWEHAEHRHRRVVANPRAPRALVAAAEKALSVIQRFASRWTR